MINMQILLICQYPFLQMIDAPNKFSYNEKFIFKDLFASRNDCWHSDLFAPRNDSWHSVSIRRFIEILVGKLLYIGCLFNIWDPRGSLHVSLVIIDVTFGLLLLSFSIQMFMVQLSKKVESGGFIDLSN